MPAQNTPVYLATVLPGLEPIAASEITAKVGDGMVREMLRGKLLFSTAQPWEHLLNLRSADNLYLFLARFVVGPHRTDLEEVERQTAETALWRAVQAAGYHPGNRLSFVVNASRSGKHTYSRFDLAAAAAQGVLKQHPRWRQGTAEAHQLEFRLDVADGTALLSLRLTPPAFRFRGDERSFSMAALRPTVAHALVWLSEPGPDDSFLDPFCGSGTLLAERAAYPARQILGGDASDQAVQAARQNLPGMAIQTWDARDLPLDAGSIDTVVSNLPFGQQILTPDVIGSLYAGFLKELVRVLRPHGQAYLLTDQVSALEAAAYSVGLNSEQLFPLSLKGLHPWVFRVTRSCSITSTFSASSAQRVMAASSSARARV